MNAIWTIRLLTINFSVVGNALFLPIIRVLSSILFCNKSTSFLVYLDTLKCWKGEHITHVVTGMIFLVIYCSVNISFLYIVSDINKSSKSFWAKKTTTPDIILFIVKIILCGIDVFSSNENYDILIIFICFFFSFIVVFSFYIYNSYY